MDFSVLMSVYMKERPEFLEQSLRSLLIKQTLLPTEVVLVEDGPLTEELEAVISNYVERFPTQLRLVRLGKNQGLGKALSIGLHHCNFELVARMDSDDVCHERRFETQVKHFEENRDLTVLGGSIAEFYNTPSQPTSQRRVPCDIQGIVRMMKRRNPINHVSVMFKKSAVINAGGYMHLPYLEDYYLWIRMIETKCLMANLDDILVYVRIGEGMFRRRGNKEYIRGWYLLQRKMKAMNLINVIGIASNMISIIGFIYTPPILKSLIYRNFLRK